MATVTFYKTKINRSNRAYDGAALDTILNAAPKLAFDVPNGVIPNVPFVIRSGETAAITDILNGYDYITYTYSGKTFYAFLDSVQFLATSAGNCSVMHSTDVWAMAIKYSADTLHFNGNVERAHVNDLIKVAGAVYPDMGFTTGATEANYNTMLVKTNRPKMAEFAPYVWYLYVYFANPRELNVSSGKLTKQQSWFPDGVNKSGFTSEGITCVYVGETPNKTAPFTQDIQFHALKTRNPTTNSDIVNFTIHDLTSSAITAMTLSKIPPVSGAGRGTVTTFGVSRYSTPNIVTWAQEYINSENYGDIYQFDIITPDPPDGLPPYLNVFFAMCGTMQNYQYEITNNDNVPVQHYTNFSEYLLNIPKMKSNIYNPVYIEKNIRQTVYKGKYNDKLLNIRLSYTPDLKNLCVIFPEDNEYMTGQNRYMIIPNKSIFAPDVTIDYWTRLNAEQTGLQAQSAKFNAITGAIFAPIKGAIGGGLAGSAKQGKQQSDENYNLGIAGAVAGGIASTVNAIGNAVYDIQSADRLQEVADRQYNCGNTEEFNTTGLYNSLANKHENILSQVSVELQYDVIAPQLHRYGYNTFLQIDEIYANHKRECFNYFKGVDVSVSGVMQAWCDEIAAMFNSGVTLWQSDVENYERVNYQQGLWEDN